MKKASNPYLFLTTPIVMATVVFLVLVLFLLMTITGTPAIPLSRATAEISHASNPIQQLSTLSPVQHNPTEHALDEMIDLAFHLDASEVAGQWKVVRMRVTAYCPCSKCCGRFADGKTACNHRIRPGDVFVAADKKYRFGTEILVPGYNFDRPVKVLDRGRLIQGNRIDIFVPSHRQAQRYGVKYLDCLVRE